jgi:hypothetical protein
MGDKSSPPASQSGSSKTPFLADPAVPHGEDSAEDAVQAPAFDGTINRRVAHADRS